MRAYVIRRQGRDTFDMLIRRGPFETATTYPEDPLRLPGDPNEPGGGDRFAARHEVRFNSCRPLIDAGNSEFLTAYGTVLHEVGHVYGIGRMFGASEDDPDHPTIGGATTNYISEADCSPHPFDIMAMYALYQTEKPQ